MSIPVAQAIGLAVDLTNVAMRLMEQSRTVSSMVLSAQAQGRAELTDAEWSAIRDADMAARSHLQDAITAREASLVSSDSGGSADSGGADNGGNGDAPNQ